jgi:hypothetical protein
MQPSATVSFQYRMCACPAVETGWNMPLHEVWFVAFNSQHTCLYMYSAASQACLAHHVQEMQELGMP